MVEWMRNVARNQKNHEMDQRHHEKDWMTWRVLDLDLSLCYFLYHLESSWHETTSKEKEAYWNCMEDFGRNGGGLAEVSIIAYEGLASLGLALFKVLVAKWRLAWVSLRDIPWG